MSKWLMRGHFEHLNFNTFPMTPRTLQCEEIWPLKSSFEFSEVLEDSIFPLLGVWVAFSHLAPKWGCDTDNTMNAHLSRFKLIPNSLHLKNHFLSFSSWVDRSLKIVKSSRNIFMNTSMFSRNTLVTTLWL